MRERQHVQRDFVSIPGAKLYYESAGGGMPVVLLHGGLLDSRMWDEHFPLLTRNFRVVRYDMRGTGKTEAEPSSEPYAHYQDLYALLQALGIMRATLVGLSLGARVAIDFALAYPAMVQELVLASPSIGGFVFQDPWIHQHYTELFQAMARRDLGGMVEQQLVLWLDGPYRTPEQVDPVVRARCRTMVERAFVQSRQAPDARDLEPPALGRLDQIHAPVLVVLGEKDVPEIHANGELLKERIDGAQITRLAAAGHTLVMERPDDFNTLLADFLSV